MRLSKTLLLLLIVILTCACGYVPRLDEVIPDRRTEYKKSETLPELEVPPDLTVNTDTDPLTIPNEEATTLSEFEQQKRMRHGGAAAAPGAQVNEQWLTVQGGNADIWPKLKEFWVAKGYTLDLDDQELGVLETNWKEMEQEGIAVNRNKFSIFAEAGSSPGSTILFLTSQRQEKIATGGEDADWIDISNNVEVEKQLIGELNLHFYGNQPPAGSSSLARAAESAAPPRPATSSAPPSNRPRAEMLSLGDDKIYLSLPEEFNRAWNLTETAILNAGMFIDNKDRTKGLYYVTYSDLGEEKQKKGLLSKLKFWGNKDEPKAYQISLTGVGDKTELVILNDKGDWANQDEATRILTLLQGQYNSAL